jgi:RNA-binding, Nab2-type zinc finger
MADDRSITDCEHYMRGNCRWGFECLFRHPTVLHEPQVVCKFWQTYSCTNKFCQFLHPAVLPTTYPAAVYKSKHHTVSKEPAELKDTSNTVCAYYMSGRCSKPACPFLHSLPEAVSSRHSQSCKSAALNIYLNIFTLKQSTFEHTRNLP